MGDKCPAPLDIERSKSPGIGAYQSIDHDISAYEYRVAGPLTERAFLPFVAR